MGNISAKLPQPPKNFSTHQEALNYIAQAQYALLQGGSVIGDPETLPVSSGVAVGFASIPKQATYAIVVLTVDPTSTIPSNAVRYSQNGKSLAPTAASGMPLGDMGSFEVTGSDALRNTRFIGVEAGKNHVIHVEYYGQIMPSLVRKKRYTPYSGLGSIGGVVLPPGSWYLRGDAVTPNSVRIAISGTDVMIQELLSGVWTNITSLASPV